MMRFGAGILRFVCLVGITGLAVTAIGFEAKALQDPALPPDEGARLALIDYCVLQESSKHGQYANYVETCKCATSKLMSEMNQGEMEGVAKWKKPISAVKKRWESAWASCGN